MRNRVNELESQLKLSSRSQSPVPNDISAQRLASLEAENSALRLEIDDLKETHIQDECIMRDMQKVLEMERAAKERDAQGYNAQIEGLKKLEGENERLKEQVRIVGEQCQKDLQEFEEQYIVLKGENDDLVEKIASKEKEMLGLNDMLQAVSAEKEKLMAESMTVAAQLGELKSQFENVSSQKDESDTKAKHLEEQLSQMKKQLENMPPAPIEPKVDSQPAEAATGWEVDAELTPVDQELVSILESGDISAFESYCEGKYPGFFQALKSLGFFSMKGMTEQAEHVKETIEPEEVERLKNGMCFVYA